MILDVSLAAGALADISHNTQGARSRVLQRSLIEAIRAHGTLVFSATNDWDAIRRAVVSETDLTDDEKLRWRELLIQLNKESRVRVSKPGIPAGISSIASPSELQAIYASFPLLAVLGLTHFARLYPNSVDGEGNTDPGITVATAESASEVNSVQAVRTLAASGLHPIKAKRDDVWDYLFHRLARRTHHVTIFDRYVFKELAYRKANSHSSNRPDEHLMWMLHQLDTHGMQGTSVKIYGAFDFDDVPASATAVAQLIKDKWVTTNGRVTSIEIIGCRWDPRIHPHNRHLRFGDSWGYDLLEGLDRLKSPQLRIGEGFTWTYKWRFGELGQMRAREAEIEGTPNLGRARAL